MSRETVEIVPIITTGQSPKPEPEVCTLSGKPIVKPFKDLGELQRRIEDESSTSPAARIRRLLNDTDSELN